MFSEYSIYKPERHSLLYLVLIGLSGVLIGFLSTSQFYILIVLIFIASALTYVFLQRPSIALILIVISSMLTRYKFAAPGGHWRLDQVLSLFALITIVRITSQLRKDGVLRPDVTTTIMALWLLLNFLASLLAPKVFVSEKIVIWLITDFIIYLFILRITDIFGLGKPIKAYIIFSIVEVVYGLGAYFMHFSDHVSLRAVGTMEEPDVFGAFVLILFTFALFSKKRFVEISWVAKYRVPILTLCTGALVLSGTRSALYGLVVEILLALFIYSRQRVRLVIGIFSVILAAFLVILIIPHNQMISRFLETTNSATLQYRLIRVKEALGALGDNWIHLILGHGTNSFGQYFFTTIDGKWVGDYLPVQLLTVPFNTGMLGSVLMVVYLGLYVFRYLKTRKIEDTNLEIFRISLYALFGLFIAYQATNGIWFSYTWILLAINVSAYKKWKSSWGD